MSFAQQGWFAPPHARQVPLVEIPVVTQTLPGEQVSSPSAVTAGQHGCSTPPQATQVEPPPELDRQIVFGAVQRLPVQQGSPRLPHSPHAPAEQVAVMLLLHWLPSSLQVAPPTPVEEETQHPSSRQRLPGQHGSPEPPQAVQVWG